jgi:multicomponent Na+:H+ antiporter subunit C
VIVANYLVSAVVFCLGLYTVLTRRNMIKMVMGLSLMESSTYLLFVSLAYRAGSTAPVLLSPPAGQSPAELAHGNAADPVLQNFCLTAIVIGVAQHYHSLDTDDVRELRG